jgi:hypothetical protein
MSIQSKFSFIQCCVIGLATITQAAYLLGADNEESSFSVFDTETLSVVATAELNETLTGLTYAGDNTYYGVVDTGTGSVVYRYEISLSSDNELTYESAVAMALSVGPIGAIEEVDGTLLTIENDTHYNNSSNKKYGELYSIDLTESTVTSLERYNYKTEVEGLAYNGDGLLYYAETAYGNDTWIGAVDTSTYEDIYFGFYTHLVNETITGLAYVDDTLYGTGSQGLYSFDMTTGSATLITSGWGANIDALTEFYASVPEPGSAASFLLLLGIPLFRRQRARA